jgi:CrcB protein
VLLILAVAIAGAAGAACRYAVDGVVQRRWNGFFPAGTFVVNTSGAFLLGLVTGFFLAHPLASSTGQVVLGTGFVGSYSTFSTLAYETLSLSREGAHRYALVNLVVGTVAGLGTAAVGMWLGHLL